MKNQQFHNQPLFQSPLSIKCPKKNQSHLISNNQKKIPKWSHSHKRLSQLPQFKPRNPNSSNNSKNTNKKKVKLRKIQTKETSYLKSYLGRKDQDSELRYLPNQSKVNRILHQVDWPQLIKRKKMTLSIHTEMTLKRKSMRNCLKTITYLSQMITCTSREILLRVLEASQ